MNFSSTSVLSPRPRQLITFYQSDSSPRVLEELTIAEKDVARRLSALDSRKAAEDDCAENGCGRHLAGFVLSGDTLVPLRIERCHNSTPTSVEKERFACEPNKLSTYFSAEHDIENLRLDRV